MRFLRSVLFALVPCALLLYSTPDAVAAGRVPPVAVPPSDPVVSLTKDLWHHFPNALEELSRRGNVAILVEGVPLTPTLPETVGTDSGPGDALPLSQIVGKFAQAYDYEAQRKGNVFFLKKRYTNPADLPGVTLEECQALLRDSLRLLQRFSKTATGPQPQSPALIRAVLSSLSGAQTRQLKSSQGLALTNLTLPQRTRLESLLLMGYVGFPMNFARQDLALLDKAPSIVFARKKWSDEGEVLGFEHPQESFWPVHFVFGQPVGAANVNRDTGKRAGANETLQAVLDKLNEQAGMKRFFVDPVLGARPIMAVGLERAGTEPVFSALAALLGLRLVKSDGDLHLLRPTVRPPRTVGDVAVVARQTVPDSLRRALHEDPEGSYADSISQIGTVVRAMMPEAVQQIKEEVEPLLPKYNGRVPFTSLSPKARSAFALRCIAEYLVGGLSHMNAQLPPYLAAYTNEPERLYLRQTARMLNLETSNGSPTLISYGLPEESISLTEPDGNATP